MITLFLLYLLVFWKALNARVFEGFRTNPESVVSKAVAFSIEVSSASSSLSKSNWDVCVSGPSLPSWKAPCPGLIKFNCDGALMVNLDFGEVAFVA